MSYMMGIDIGGTNTDAVLINQKKLIIAACKVPTEKPLENGVKKSIAKLLESSGIDKNKLQGIYIGTTHATNAILEAKGLYKVGVLRLAGHNPLALDPCFKWPIPIREAIFLGVKAVGGGFRCDQKEITPLSEREIRRAILELRDLGLESLAIVGVFSSLSSKQEDEARTIAKDILGDNFPITISSEIGGTGFIERENGAILNSALKKPMVAAFQNMKTIKRELGIEAPLFVTQNDGSIINLYEAQEKPLLTISSGPTNSFIGGVKLAGLKEAIIVDIGGTSADIGIVLDGYPRRSLGQAMIGGIPLNFRMPDVLSLPIGGGSVVRRKSDGFSYGPDSIGSKLFQEGYLFGGSTLTLTDAACKCDLIANPEFQDIPLNKQEAAEIIGSVLKKIQDGIFIMRGSKKDLPILAVGGGAFFLKNMADAIPENSGVANAYGAALSEVSYTIDTVASLENREKTLSSLKEMAMQGARDKGASETNLRIVDVQIVPYHYIPNQMGRIVIIASGHQK